MRIVFHTSMIEKKMGGATISTLAVLRGLVCRGHAALIVAKKAEREEVFGIPVYQEDRHEPVSAFYAWADVVFVMRRPPLQHIKEYERWDTPHGAPPIYTVFFAHNVGQPYKNGYEEGDLDLVVFNTKWVQKETGWGGDSIVIHPPIFKEEYLVERRGHCLTQINLSRKKGGEFFWEIARALPGRQFLAVKGRERDQVIPDEIPPNVELIEYTSDIRSVYERTGVLLMPSQGYREQHRWTDEFSAESYGRVAVEAAISGIPVIAYSAPGIKEALGSAGIYCPMEVSSWVKKIEELLCDADYYEKVSERFRRIGESLDPLGDIERFERLLLERVPVAVERKRGRYGAYFDVFPEAKVIRLPRNKSRAVPFHERHKFLAKLLMLQRRVKERFKKLLGKGRSAGSFLMRVLAYLCLSLLGKACPRDKAGIAVLAPEHGSFADNAKYIYLRLTEEEDLNVVYITPNRDVFREIKKEGVAAEYYPSLGAAMKLLRAKAVVGVMGKSFEGVRGHLTCGAYKVQLWHGDGVKKVQLGQPSNMKNRRRLKKRFLWGIDRRFPVYDLLYFPNREQYAMRKDWFRYKGHAINDMIRNDLLRGRQFGHLVDVYTDRRCLEQIKELKDGGAKLVLYAPTRRRRDKPAFGSRIPFNFTRINDMLKSHNSYLVAKLHPRMRELVDFTLFDRILEYDKLRDIYPALKYFDCLITDYSSIANDYKILKRPIIRYFPDYEWVISSGMISKEAYSKMPGTLCLNFEDMLNCLENILKGPGDDGALGRPGNFSGDRLVEDIRQLLGRYKGEVERVSSPPSPPSG